jgi:hypothetical protein
MKARWEHEKNVVKRPARDQGASSRPSGPNADLLQRQGTLEKVAEIRYGIIPGLEKAAGEAPEGADEAPVATSLS